jgi:hypothetical protein
MSLGTQAAGRWKECKRNGQGEVDLNKASVAYFKKNGVH